MLKRQDDPPARRKRVSLMPPGALYQLSLDEV